MRNTRAFTRLLPASALCAVAALMLSTTPASANSGWWYSGYSKSKGYFTSYGDKTTACDISTDGYKALVQIVTVNDSLVYRVVDSWNDGKCTSKDASDVNLLEGATYQIEVCVVKSGGRPLDCRAHRFTA
ncbi:hypothetical protein [Streptomyces olivaceus]|uniref:hypothetical protein n=1 Tax=Streptomyces olivaceus TaxID=47716 RepID=UPI0022EEC1CA|nr:hypothetical protein [Streptomyces olivaceus]GHI97999.1 hypothetical protein TPA0905_74700 [Streptomyces olivaceus]